MIRRFGALPASAVRPAATLSLWSLFVWGGRLRNLIAEPRGLGDLTGGDRWSLTGSFVFGILALATVAALVVNRRFAVLPATPLAVLSVVVWAYRAVVILGRDYSVGFLAVHTVLAGVSIGLGVWLLRAIARPPLEVAAEQRG